MLMLWPRQFFLTRLTIFLQPSVLGVPIGFWSMFLPGLSVGLAVVWGFGRRGNGLRLAAAIALAFVFPPLLLASQVIGTSKLFAQISPLLDSREPTKIVQSNTYCSAIPALSGAPQQLKVVTFLALADDSEKTAVFPTNNLIAMEVREKDGEPFSSKPPSLIGDFSDSTDEIVLSNSSYARFEFFANFVPGENPQLANGKKFKCMLAYAGFHWSGGDIEDRTVMYWR
jgi:hypothetical protein